MEVLDLYDDNNHLSNMTIQRGSDDIPAGYKIKLCVVWISNKKAWLIQKCSVKKGGEWAVSGGHVSHGNSSIQQAVIELKEEMGLNVDGEELKLLGSIIKEKLIFDIFLLEKDIDIDTLKCQKKEVEKIQWFTKPEIEQLISEGTIRQSSKEHYEKFIKHVY